MNEPQNSKDHQISKETQIMNEPQILKDHQISIETNFQITLVSKFGIALKFGVHS